MVKKIFVYEISSGFSSMLKRYYSDKIIIERSKETNFISQYYYEYEACFFLINNVRDYNIFENVLKKIKTIFVITSVKLYEYKIETMQAHNVIILNFNDDIKKEMIKTINFNLELYKII